jgi:hypothetical protein
MLSTEDAGTGKGGLTAVFMTFVFSDLLFPQEFETLINEMPILLAVIAELSLIETIPMSIVSFLKSSSLFFNPSTLPPSKVGNPISKSIPNSFLSHFGPISLAFECQNLSIELRRLQGVDSFPHRLLKSLPGGTQRSKEGNVDVDVRERFVKVVVEVLKARGKGGDVGLNRGAGGGHKELVEVAGGHCSSGCRNSAMLLEKASPDLACRVELIHLGQL